MFEIILNMFGNIRITLFGSRQWGISYFQVIWFQNLTHFTYEELAGLPS